MVVDGEFSSEGSLRQSIPARVGEALGCSAGSMRRLAGSIVNLVHAIRCGERQVIVKLGAADGIRREAAVLTMLRQTAVPVPHAVLVAADAVFPHDMLLLDVLPGQHAEPGSEVLADAGQCLRRLHDLALPGFGLVCPDRLAGTHDTWAGFLDAVVANAAKVVPASIMSPGMHDEVGVQLRRMRDHLARVHQGVLLHGDLVPKHVWSEADQLAGLIDWGDAMVGDPLFDLARFSMAGRDDFQLLLRGYGGPFPPDERILSLYRLVWSLMALTVECGAGGDWVADYVSTVRRELAFCDSSWLKGAARDPRAARIRCS
ncbi:phosphotransferase family protein [Micromonospora sp. CB01531]|uniref:phosphotransferase family protein n=1 Tax=Micromonospora sp. CB01531 TaxID=1718947 RepID=UPI00093B9E67|nr:aminoglycoside phosphotransferase family protein [Micromonospora sp. CB01531]OKI44714.1 hypothetical protein A6A27_38335 [Micromonospora sp. CB01531]